MRRADSKLAQSNTNKRISSRTLPLTLHDKSKRVHCSDFSSSFFWN